MTRGFKSLSPRHPFQEKHSQTLGPLDSIWAEGCWAFFLHPPSCLLDVLLPVSPDWGDDLSVERNGDGTFTLSSSMSGDTFDAEYNEVGCLDGEIGDDKTGKVKFEGYMSASQLYDSHNPNMFNKIGFGAGAAVAIHSMSFEEAKNILSGEGERVDVKDWSDPVAPETGAGTADLDNLPKDSDSKWFVLGLIPASENINDGFAALGKYHQPIRVPAISSKTNWGIKWNWDENGLRRFHQRLCR